MEKVEVANDDVAKALVPEKVLESERSVVEAPVVGHALRQSPLTQSVLAEKTDDDALPKVARPVNHEAPESERRVPEALVKVVVANALVPEKVLLFDRSVEEAAVMV